MGLVKTQVCADLKYFAFILCFTKRIECFDTITKFIISLYCIGWQWNVSYFQLIHDLIIDKQGMVEMEYVLVLF